MPFLAQLFAAASYQVAWSIYVSDYSRYLPRDVGVSASFWWTYLGAFVGGSWTMLVGTVAAALHPNMEFTTAVGAAADAVIPGFGKPLLLCSLLGLLTITTLNFYGASFTLLSVADSLKPSRLTLGKRVLTLVISVVAASSIALASTENFVEKFGEFLAVLLYLFTPWTAINLVDFYWVRKGHYSVRKYSTRTACTDAGIGAACRHTSSGFVAMVPFFSVNGLYIGPVAAALGGADIAMLVGLPVSTVVYLWACRSLDVEADRRRAEAADVGLDPDTADDLALAVEQGATPGISVSIAGAVPRSLSASGVAPIRRLRQCPPACARPQREIDSGPRRSALPAWRPRARREACARAHSANR